jgi:hypothetical protein
MEPNPSVGIFLTFPYRKDENIIWNSTLLISFCGTVYSKKCNRETVYKEEIDLRSQVVEIIIY